MNKLFSRVYQKTLKLCANFVRWHETEIISNVDWEKRLCEKLRYCNLLIVTDSGIINTGICDKTLKKFTELGVKYWVYSKTKPNPTVENVEQALKIAVENNCDAVVAIGGGSAIDCGKIVSARMAKPNMSIKNMRGLLKIKAKLPPFVAIPTTAGTGSEVTIAAVIKDEETHEKYVISDHCLTPKYAVLDYKLTVSLPKHLTGSTGMDTLTHAIEAYIGGSNTRKTKAEALESIKLIHDNLLLAYHVGDNQKGRKCMQIASLKAGKAFTRGYVGNVHAIAHAIGGIYDTPHGLANAVIMPIVLKEYGKKAYSKLAKISDYLFLMPIKASKKEKAEAVILWIENLNKEMQIPQNFDFIKNEDIKEIATRAEKEANPLYPVPEIWDEARFVSVIKKIKGDNHEQY